MVKIVEAVLIEEVAKTAEAVWIVEAVSIEEAVENGQWPRKGGVAKTVEGVEIKEAV